MPALLDWWAWGDLRQLRRLPRFGRALEEALDVVAGHRAMRVFCAVADRCQARAEPSQRFAGLGAHLRVGVAIRGELGEADEAQCARRAGDAAFARCGVDERGEGFARRQFVLLGEARAARGVEECGDGD